MTITKNGDWLIDTRGNRASIEYFGSEEAARKALNSLVNCSNCSNCSGCSWCSNCSGCSELRRQNGFHSDAQATPIKTPTITNIHQRVYEAASQPGALNMSDWHCGTTHCRAGWVVTLAGDAGKALEEFHSTSHAAMLIYHASSPIAVLRAQFFVSDEDALADMKRCAEMEAKGQAGPA